MAKSCERVLRDILAPLLHSDGAELYLVSVDDKTVRVHLGGTLSGSPAVGVVTERVIRPALAKVSARVEVIVTDGYSVPAGATLLTPAP
ncbi:MAG: NifU family protein [Myxococcota bacterium]